MYNYISTNFLLPLNNGDKTIRIQDRKRILKYSINSQSISNTLTTSNYIRIYTSNDIIILDFISITDAELALSYLNNQINTVKSKFPLVVTGSPLLINGPQGEQGPTGSIGPTGNSGLLFMNYNGLSYSTINSTITLTQSQSNWNTSDSSNVSFILNKPDLSQFGGVQQYGSNTYFPSIGNPYILYIDISNNLGWYWLTQSSTYSCLNDIFKNDIIVNLSNGKTFGRYSSGTTIPAIGKTPAQIILQATSEPVNPTITLSTSPTSLTFNQSNPIITINFGYTINSLGAIANSGLLQYYSNHSLTWNTIYNTIGNGTTYSISGFTYDIPSIDNPQFNTTSFQFRYLVTDTLSATNSSISNVNISSYTAPTLTLVGSASHIGLSIETNNNREIGNTNTILKGNITRNSTNVPLLYYQFFIKINNGNYVSISPTYSINSASSSVSFNYNDTTATSSATSVIYQLSVTDIKTTTLLTYTINYNYVIFYGSVNNSSVNSSEVRSLTNYQFLNGSNPFSLSSGTTLNGFEIALPLSHTISTIYDSTQNFYIIPNKTTFSVNDRGGIPTSYNIYDVINSSPYTTNQNIQITYL